MGYQSHINLPGLRQAYSSAIVRHTQSGFLKRYSAGQVFQTGSNSKKLQVIVSGFAKTSVLSESGGEDILGFLMPGDVLGLSTLALDPMCTDIIFLTDVVIAELSLEEARQLEIAIGELGAGVSDLISRELLRTQWRNRLVRFACVKSRVARFLLEMSRRFAEIDLPSHKFRLFMPREDIAIFLGMTKSTLSRTLHLLCTNRLIDIDGRWIEILEPSALGEMQP